MDFNLRPFARTRFKLGPNRGNDLPVGFDPPIDFQMIQREKIVSIFDFDLAGFRVREAEAERLVEFFHFPGVRMGCAVRGDQAVAEEIELGRHPVRPPIAAVAEIPVSLFIGLPYALVDPVPDEAALELFVGVDRRPSSPGKLPTLLPMAWAYSHRIRGRAWGLFGVVEDPLDCRRTSGRRYRCCASSFGRFVLNRAGRIALLDPAVGRLEVRAVARPRCPATR